jgi:hypothetical protein
VLISKPICDADTPISAGTTNASTRRTGLRHETSVRNETAWCSDDQQDELRDAADKTPQPKPQEPRTDPVGPMHSDHRDNQQHGRERSRRKALLDVEYRSHQRDQQSWM